ncbi:MAG: mobile mystery protein B [Ignavibacteriaceae bacterium]|nr:mobile mystery protein B [Ignavibacteriaceae bacterium]
MGLDPDYSAGNTPLDDDEKSGLLIKTITTRGELDEFEQIGIDRAINWLYGKRFDYKSIVSEEFIKNLHKIMFRDIWEWAGEYRKSNKNIGSDKFLIPSEIRILIEDVIFWIENNTFTPDETSVRFSHRLVKIHPFANGNGRHSRLMGDILINKHFALPVFSWGSGALLREGDLRKLYITSLRCADNLDYTPLIQFARL